MFEDFFCKRLTQLRQEKGVSARDMSLSLGQSESYINRIENRQMLPSMTVFFYICEYFHMSPKEFFNDGLENSLNSLELLHNLQSISEEERMHIAAIVKALKDK